MKRFKFKATPVLHGIPEGYRECFSGLIVPGDKSRAKELFLEYQPGGERHLENGHVFLGEDLVAGLEKSGKKEVAKYFTALGLEFFYVHKMFCTVVKKRKKK